MKPVTLPVIGHGLAGASQRITPYGAGYIASKTEQKIYTKPNAVASDIAYTLQLFIFSFPITLRIKIFFSSRSCPVQIDFLAALYHSLNSAQTAAHLRQASPVL